MIFAYVGFAIILYVLYRLLRFGIPLLSDWLYGLEERMADRGLIERMEDPEVNRIISDGLAAFTPGRLYLVAGAIAGIAAVAAVPFSHLLYALWIRFFMLFTDPMHFGSKILNTTLHQILGYLPRVAVNMLTLTLVGIFYAQMRRKYLQEDRVTSFLFFRVPTVEVFGTILGWFLYFMAAVIPRASARGTFTFLGMLTLGGGWVWVFSGVVVSMYLRWAQNAALWVLFRYRWSQAIPAAVRMTVLRRLPMPPSILQEITVDEKNRAVTVRVQIDAIDAQRLHDSLLALPDLRSPRVIPLGPPPGYPVRIGNTLAPRMRPLPPRSFRRPEGPPKGYGAELNLLDSVQDDPNCRDGNTEATPRGK